MYIKRLHYKEIDSTHSFAKREEKSLDLYQWTAITADNQSEGRGQSANSWRNEPGHALLCTLVSPALNWSADELMARHLATVIVLCEELAPYAKEGLGIKWPNDVFMNGRKLAGILSEAIWEGKKCRRYIGSIGVNITAAPAGFAYLGDGLDVEEIRNLVLKAWVEAMNAVPAATQERFNALLVHRGKGQWKRADTGELLHLECVGVDSFGRLGLKTPDGSCAWFHHGEISWIPENPSGRT